MVRLSSVGPGAVARRAGSLVAVATAGACSPSPQGPAAPPAEVDFPSGFMWGSATSGFQVEDNDANTDWAAWVDSGKVPSGDSPNVGGPDALDHVDEDIANLVQRAVRTRTASRSSGAASSRRRPRSTPPRPTPTASPCTTASWPSSPRPTSRRS